MKMKAHGIAGISLPNNVINFSVLPNVEVIRKNNKKSDQNHIYVWPTAQLL
jgi:hypothetical protein